jgi:hypothetical protein
VEIILIRLRLDVHGLLDLGNLEAEVVQRESVTQDESQVTVWAISGHLELAARSMRDPVCFRDGHGGFEQSRLQ